MPLSDEMIAKAEAAAAAIDADVYLYNGTVRRALDLQCVEAVFDHIGRPKALLIVVTDGGDPDAAYKITRYFQEKYDSFTVLIPGMCKSAGTLIAVGATELAFTPFGELGPLDIQLAKVDRFDQLASGLSIQDALDTLEGRAKASFYRIVQEYIQANNGLMSFATAAKAASDFVTQLYAPVFSRIDPEEVGARSRSMRIAIDYGKRLSLKSQNAKPDTLKTLAETFSSHSFVIDLREAQVLFHRAREANSAEKELVKAIGKYARFETSRADRSPEFTFRALSKSVKKPATSQKPIVAAHAKTKAKAKAAPKGSNGHEKANSRGDAAPDGANPPGANGTPNPPAAGGRGVRKSVRPRPGRTVRNGAPARSA